MKQLVFILVVVCITIPSIAETQLRNADLEEVRIHYDVKGNGEPLVLIHGWTHNLHTWDQVVPSFSNHFEVIRYDRRGCGDSGGFPDTSADPVDLNELLAYLDVKKAYVLGHSQGARVALAFALTYPERVQALILYGSPAPVGFGLPWDGPDRLPNSAEIARNEGLERLGEVLFKHPITWLPEDRQGGRKLAEQIWQSYTGRDLLENQPPSGKVPSPSMDRLREIKIPTLILVGEREIQYFKIVAEALAYGITGAKKAVVSNSGHLAHYAEPERFTAEVLRFLSGVEASAEVEP